jgi:hypothetical protein
LYIYRVYLLTSSSSIATDGVGREVAEDADVRGAPETPDEEPWDASKYTRYMYNDDPHRK